MYKSVINIEGLGKLYHIGRKQADYRTLRDTVTDAFMSPLRKVGNLVKGKAGGAAGLEEELWALKDISLEIKVGEVVGIIGRNGAGKSTLLKILSRITEPTTGLARIYGRIGSLLEVGTGFHPELTGRENVFLNGAILGMKKMEIRRKFDEIVEFAEISKFVDTPVKHYSSGMYLRLAFAVAAHLEPDILIVDEVLAVGDARFQKKCMNKMEDVSHHGRTILFVSHNMPAITRICKRAVLLENGKIVKDGPAHQVVSSYLNSNCGTSAQREWGPKRFPGGEIARLRAVRIRSADGRISDAVDIRKPVFVDMEYDILKPGYICMPNFLFSNEDGIELFSAHDVDPEWRRRTRPSGSYTSTAVIPGNFLSEGTVFIAAGFQTIDPDIYQFYERDAVAFQVIDSMDGNSARGDYSRHMTGVVRPLLKWKTKYRASEVGEDWDDSKEDKL